MYFFSRDYSHTSHTVSISVPDRVHQVDVEPPVVLGPCVWLRATGWWTSRCRFQNMYMLVSRPYLSS